jgi:hypothetical protein
MLEFQIGIFEVISWAIILFVQELYRICNFSTAALSLFSYMTRHSTRSPPFTLSRP